MKKKNFNDLLEETVPIEICSDILVEGNIEEEYESLSLENLERGNKIFKIEESEKEDNEIYQLEFRSGEGSFDRVTMNDEEVFMNDGEGSSSRVTLERQGKEMECRYICREKNALSINLLSPCFNCELGR